MKNRFIARAVALVLVLSIVVAIGAAPAPERDPFKGKVVVVAYNEFNNTVRVSLEQARVQKLGERYYIVGKVVESGIPGFMVGGGTLWISENNVSSIAEYESVEKMTNALEQPAKGKMIPAKGKMIPLEKK
jgi:hypothetical protein